MKNNKRNKLFYRILFIVGVVVIITVPYFLFAKLILKFRWEVMIICTTICIITMMTHCVLEMRGKNHKTSDDEQSELQDINGKE